MGKTMNRKQFNDWLRANNACTSAVGWCDQHPELSVQELMSICPRGEWILWVYARAGYARDVLAPVAYRAATRAMGYAADALDRVGVQHSLLGLVIHDVDSAMAAAMAAARAARAARAAERAAERAALDVTWADALDVAWAARAALAAEWAASDAADAAAMAARAARAAWAARAALAAEWAASDAADAAAMAARAARAAEAAEHKICADDCRQLLPELRIEV